VMQVEATATTMRKGVERFMSMSFRGCAAIRRRGTSNERSSAETNERSPSPIHCHDAEAVDRTSTRRSTSSTGGMKWRRSQRNALPRGKDYHCDARERH
jgi:hypothetical protein